MTTDLETAVCVRWRFEQVAYAASDLVRVRHRDGVTLALLANAGDSGFSTFWPAGSCLLLDEFETARDSSAGAFDDQLGLRSNEKAPATT